jgi:hypothetical protein
MREILEAAVLFAMLDNTRIKYLILLFVTTNYQSLAGNDSVKADYQMCRRDSLESAHRAVGQRSTTKSSHSTARIPRHGHFPRHLKQTTFVVPTRVLVDGLRSRPEIQSTIEWVACSVAACACMHACYQPKEEASAEVAQRICDLTSAACRAAGCS